MRRAACSSSVFATPIPELGLAVKRVQNRRAVALAGAPLDADRDGPSVGESTRRVVTGTSGKGSIRRQAAVNLTTESQRTRARQNRSAKSRWVPDGYAHDALLCAHFLIVVVLNQDYDRTAFRASKSVNLLSRRARPLLAAHSKYEKAASSMPAFWAYPN
jgi:hypothetical protein